MNGENASPIYRFLKAEAPGEDGQEDIPWNFTKFLGGPDGRVIARFAPPTTPEQIEEVLLQHLPS